MVIQNFVAFLKKMHLALCSFNGFVTFEIVSKHFTMSKEDLTEDLNQEITENTTVDLDDHNLYYFDDSKSFEANLKEFFEKFRPSKLSQVKKIAKKFKGQEEECLDYLYYKYVTRVDALTSGKRIPGYVPGKRLAPRIGDEARIQATRIDAGENKGVFESDFTQELSSKAQRSGFKKLLIPLLVLLVLAVCFFMFKDKLFSSDATQEQPALEEQVDSQVQPELQVEESIEQAQEKPVLSQEVEALLNSGEKVSQENLALAKTKQDTAAIMERLLDQN